ncbi:uncharacterized protein DUF1707 [Antricoccus suffuscus]|uniref:Uncharacterized protein DUF1707 n=1 Tax=Antricoccus suffuscus TaxID=1629062 RepID=A0A2T1A6B3_9ACTN|nr:DUF1707 domain-containing protein [Antricoccus suffuscus]PRZ44153.1 uncharacterized protein DUF1707 [Antricoccus suffuscus]
MTDTPHTSDGHLRIGDAEREIVIGRLSLAHSLGQLDADEYAERNEAAVNAKTRNDLADLTSDLPDPDGSKTEPRKNALARGAAKIESGARTAWGSHKVLTAVGIVLLLNMIAWTVAGIASGGGPDFEHGEHFGAMHGGGGDYEHGGGPQFLVLPILIGLFIAMGIARRRSHRDQ